MKGVIAGRIVATIATVAAIAAASAGAASAATTSSTPSSTNGTTTTGTTTGTTPTTTTTPAAPVFAKVTLTVPDGFLVNHKLVTVPKRTVHVHGVVSPYVAGQWVLVQDSVNGKVFKTDHLRIQPAPGGRNGQFTETLSSPKAGRVTVQVGHTRNAALGGLLVRRSFEALNESVSFGSSGPFVALIQQRLAALHFYIPQTGVYDTGTGLAIDAYHRLLRSGTSQTLDSRTISFLLDGYGQFPVRFPGNGRHAEGNLSLQLLALVDGSHVVAIYPISSGKPSTPTILGNFQVYSRVPGYLPDGMYFSNFFIRGYAIHGYDPAPDYPASHGCMRLPIVDAISVFNWLAIGDWVDTYY